MTGTDRPSAEGDRVRRRVLAPGIVELAFDRPTKLNAIDEALESAFSGALRELGEDEDLRAVFVTGLGGAFSAGRDMSEISWLADSTAADTRRKLEVQDRWLTEVWTFRQPVVAVVERFAFGQAAELVGRCDLAICDAEAQFGWPEVRAGGVPASVWPVTLEHRKLVAECLMTGRSFTAREARAVGLVNHVARPGKLDELRTQLAQNLSALDPTSLAAVKTVMRHAAERGGALESVERGMYLNSMAHESPLASDYWTRVEREGPRAAAKELGAGAIPYWEHAEPL